MTIPFNFSHLDVQHNVQLVPTNTPTKKAVSINGRDYKIKGEEESVLLLRSHLASLRTSEFESIRLFEASLKSVDNQEKIDSVFQRTLIAEANEHTKPERILAAEKFLDELKEKDEFSGVVLVQHTFAGDRPLGIYESADRNCSIQFFEKNGHLFEIGIGHPEKPTECLLLKDGSFQLNDLPLMLKYNRYADSITIEENEEVIDTLKPRSLNLTETVDKLCRSLEKYYFDPKMGKKCSDYLREQLNNGAYKSISDPKKLCEAFTADLLKIAEDKHMHVRLPNLDESSSLPTIEELNGPYSLPDLDKPYEYKSMLNGGDLYLPYEIKTGFLKENSKVGYVDFRDFGNCKWKGDKPEEKEDGYDQMMDFENRKSKLIVAVNHIKSAETVIIDLRNNGGGRRNCVHLMCSLFIDEGNPLSRIEWREGDTRRLEDAHTLTHEELPEDQRLLKQTVMVLIGPNTFSAAEAFAYDMRALGRAKIVGESSAGGANPSDGIYEIGGFEFRIPEGEAVNPILEKNGERNWESKGVTPDFIVPASDALNKAIVLCTTKSW